MASVHDIAAHELGFEEGIFWLPSHVMDEACDSKIHMRNRHQKLLQHYRYPRETQSQYCSKFSTRSSYDQRPKHATGGPGMQAVFLVSGQGSCGTGVFLPQKAGTKSIRKPACAPVLLPARVVQALNLKVHQLGLQISPSQAPKYSPRSGEVCTSESTKKKTNQKDALKQCSVVVSHESQSSSPEIFLPKEWTY
ncbi:hypothetical protein AAZX31_03G135300 [Glycine max]|uniref:Uncharacterized protein n=2 Tax=Glycine subgen. Soja TaxID=1462606 RepID=I1JNT9_SOYBN|nr:uncharacterized protein LOC100796168 [Glycine max]XP_028225483.1 uncharacterized protein LOC114406853 [Glycine soja]KAG5055282.1 hypothetical protein JHK85_007792 [Glycine max]KAG5072356.1 hypothetical protein JHK86_007567 [Glycine max]KAH1070158.1 hypothetical protein GYH30_007322 [Glycine max]KAH1258288.1 hypothetical protein GmHk_03G008050 [Glycine max]KHN19890.1 hypothetical protein glysoja_033522 [Glycine soja]|eukprot:XP_003521245.1 uncharacterized protein LOC100796168 [Glycine max]